MTKNGDFDLVRLQSLLDAYGADEARWPTAERAWMREAVRLNAEARAMRDAAAELDTLLDTIPAPLPSVELESAILEAAEPDPARRWRITLWPFGPIWQPAMALSAALVLGLYVGGADIAPGNGEPALTELAELAEGIDLPTALPEAD